MNPSELNHQLKQIARDLNTVDNEQIVSEFWKRNPGLTKSDLFQLVTILLPDRLRNLVRTESKREAASRVSAASERIDYPKGQSHMRQMTTDQLEKAVADGRLAAHNMAYINSLKGEMERVIEMWGREVVIGALTIDDLQFFGQKYDEMAGHMTEAADRCFEVAEELQQQGVSAVKDLSVDRQTRAARKIAGLPILRQGALRHP